MERSTYSYSDADELRDLKQSIMQCRTVADLRSVQITIQRIREAARVPGPPDGPGIPPQPAA